MGWTDLQNRPDRLCGPLSLQFNGYRGYFVGVERPGREIDHSSSSSAEVKKEWSCTPIPPIRFHGVDWDNFTIFLIIPFFSMLHSFLRRRSKCRPRLPVLKGVNLLMWEPKCNTTQINKYNHFGVVHCNHYRLR